MKKMIKYPSIEQFRNVVKNIQHQAAYTGQDENGETVFDFLKPKPVIRVNGTEKIHGTNAGISYNNIAGMWVQSRSNIITPEKDNAGCAFTAEQNRNAWIDIISELQDAHNINLDTHTITVYYEWCGGNIQKNSAVSDMSKRAIIFKLFKVSPIEPSEDEASKWYPTCTYGGQRTFNCSNHDAEIYNIMDFTYYEFEIDFNKPEAAQNNMIACMLEIEANSPVGKQFGKDGNIGEGLVIEFIYNGARHAFKVKGDKHSASKVKVQKPVDLEALAKVDKCVEEITHEWRFVQGMTEVFGAEYERDIDRKKLGEFLKWITSDTIKEESEAIYEHGFTLKDIMGKVQKKAKDFFFAVEQL